MLGNFNSYPHNLLSYIISKLIMKSRIFLGNDGGVINVAPMAPRQILRLYSVIPASEGMTRQPTWCHSRETCPRPDRGMGIQNRKISNIFG